MKHIPTYEQFVNESTQYDSNTYPLDKNEPADKLCSGKSRGSDRARKNVFDLKDVYGNEVSILDGDIVTEYLQINSKDDSLIYKVTRSDKQQTRVFYIPSKYWNTDQYEKIQSAI
jgi:hypothetical protein